MKEFFTNIYKNIPQDQWITIWTLRDKRTEWFKSIDKIEEYVKTLQNENVFFGIGTSGYKQWYRQRDEEIIVLNKFHSYNHENN